MSQLKMLDHMVCESFPQESPGRSSEGMSTLLQCGAVCSRLCSKGANQSPPCVAGKVIDHTVPREEARNRDLSVAIFIFGDNERSSGFWRKSRKYL